LAEFILEVCPAYMDTASQALRRRRYITGR